MFWKIYFYFFKMIEKYLKKISELSIELISFKKEKWKIINSFIFPSIPKNLIEYKKVFRDKMFFKKQKFEEVLNSVNSLVFLEKELIKNEIFLEMQKINFLLEVYDIEANKIDANYIIRSWEINYDFYNELFYWVKKIDIPKKCEIKKELKENIDLFISKERLIFLLLEAQKQIKEIKWQFGDFTNMAHSNWLLKIPYKENFSLREVIVLFFHELTHLLRYLNQKRNFGFYYNFWDYNTLEEGIAQYNEFFYWNKITNYWNYQPYYDCCYNIILKDISEQEKQQKIYDILKNKWFSKEKSLNYYYRFYRYSKIWSKNLFLKDLIYTKSLKNVERLILDNDENYEKIMIWKIWIKELDFCKKNNNIDSKVFFESMLILIKKEFNL